MVAVKAASVAVVAAAGVVGVSLGLKDRKFSLIVAVGVAEENNNRDDLFKFEKCYRDWDAVSNVPSLALAIEAEELAGERTAVALVGVVGASLEKKPLEV